MSRLSIFRFAIVGTGLLSACTTTQAYSPDKLNSQYGINGAYVDTLQTGDGNLRGTVVPVTLADGRQAQLIIPMNQRTDPHALYLHDADGYHPVALQPNTTRSQLVSSPQVVTRRVEPAHANKHSWEQDALIIGGGAGGGALIGALAGGKKGAGVGAAAGGVGGLIYDLATKH